MKKWTNCAMAAAAAAVVFNIAPVSAADVPTSEPSVTQAQSPWQIRVRALGVIPRDSGRINGVAGSGLDFSNSVTPELDITYYITNNIAAELILGTTYSTINGSGSLDGFGKVGKTWMLPPTLTLQYHFTDLGKFKPYIGAGVNYTFFFHEKGNRKAAGAGMVSDLRIDDTWGTALQVGFDYMLNQNWGINFDVKKLFLRTDYHARLDNAPISGRARLDPWLIGAGVTYRF